MPICGHCTRQFISYAQLLLACVDSQELVVKMATSIFNTGTETFSIEVWVQSVVVHSCSNAMLSCLFPYFKFLLWCKLGVCPAAMAVEGISFESGPCGSGSFISLTLKIQVESHFSDDLCKSSATSEKAQSHSHQEPSTHDMATRLGMVYRRFVELNFRGSK